MDTDRLRRWWEEHSELDELVEAIRSALARGSLSAATVFLGRLSTTLEGHFSTEEDLYFPLVERASPQSKPLIDAARAGHRQLRTAVEDLHALVETAEVASARSALARLLHKLGTHEAQEAALVAELERLARGASA